MHDRVEERVLVYAPTGRDAFLTCEILVRDGFAALPCGQLEELCREIARGAGMAVLADEALSPETVNQLLDVLGSQGPWSDLPLLVFTRRDSTDDVLATLEPLGNSTLLERPVRVNTLVAACNAALRARRRQYEVRDLLHSQAQADRRKDEFLAMLGHELRNPLAAIRNAHSVLERIGSSDEPAIRQRQVIDRQTRHLARMVDDLLDISRVTLGKITLKPQPVDLQEVAERCLRELGTAAQAERQHLALEVTTEPVEVDGDPVRLEQIVSNLLHNAIKYTPPGGRISISVGKTAGEAVIRVSDSGVGIPPEMLPRVFDLFTQVESSIPRSQGGLGLGLPLVRSLVELHGGRVAAASPGPGGGSEFIVRLPLRPQSARSPSEAPPARVARGNAPGPGLRVLVIEDNRDGRESLRDLLEIWGYRVELAEDGPSGLAQALASPPDVALVDIGLPGLDGNEVARRIRATLNGNTPCLIAMTGYGQPEDKGRALAAGFDSYLVKPVDPETLARLLAEAVERGTGVTSGSPASGQAGSAAAG
jgi:signal transduction histidine kinase/ActR/RegA family two-component response regulator